MRLSELLTEKILSVPPELHERALKLQSFLRKNFNKYSQATKGHPFGDQVYFPELKGWFKFKNLKGKELAVDVAIFDDSDSADINGFKSK